MFAVHSDPAIREIIDKDSIVSAAPPTELVVTPQTAARGLRGGG